MIAVLNGVHVDVTTHLCVILGRKYTLDSHKAKMAVALSCLS